MGLEFVAVYAPAPTTVDDLFGNSVHVSTKRVEVDTRLLWIYRPIKMGWLAAYDLAAKMVEEMRSITSPRVRDEELKSLRMPF